jgi:choline dehydrogenase-like flavoprotein
VSRGVGGKTQLWNVVSLRFSQRDFKGRQHDGAGEDWPFDYSEMKPYHDRIEREIGVCGNYDHLNDLPDGIFLPPVPMKCTDLAIKAGAAKLNVGTRLDFQPDLQCSRVGCGPDIGFTADSRTRLHVVRQNSSQMRFQAFTVFSSDNVTDVTQLG